MTQPHCIDREAVFDAWLYEQEGYGLRAERLSEELRDPLDKVLPWLRAAFDVGFSAASPAPMEAVAWREAIEHLRECAKLVPAPGAIEAAERFLAVIPTQGVNPDMEREG